MSSWSLSSTGNGCFVRDRVRVATGALVRRVVGTFRGGTLGAGILQGRALGTLGGVGTLGGGTLGAGILRGKTVGDGVSLGRAVGAVAVGTVVGTVGVGTFRGNTVGEWAVACAFVEWRFIRVFAAAVSVSRSRMDSSPFSLVIPLIDCSKFWMARTTWSA